MKIYKIDKKHNFFEVEPETLDDLWTLNMIISENDVVGSKTTRRFRVEGSKDSEKKTVFIKVNVEKKELDLENSSLKLTGKIKEGYPEEFVDINSYHTLDIREGTKVSVLKENLLEFDVNLLETAKENSLLPKIYLLVLDDEETVIAKVNVRSFSIVARIKSGKAGKRLKSEEYRNKYFAEIYKTLENLQKDIVVVAGPGFEKDHFKEYLQSKNSLKNFIFTHVASTGITGLNELLKGGSVKKILEKFKIQKDLNLINELFKEIAKDGLVVYGIREVEDALEKNAIKELLVTDDFFMKNYNTIRTIFLKLDKLNTKYHIISSETDAGKQLDSIGGIAAFLYYKI